MNEKMHLPWDSKLFWICPVCGSVNAFNNEDASRFEQKTGQVCFISTGSCFDNQCGNCHANIVEPDSPILAPCYTHKED